MIPISRRAKGYHRSIRWSIVVPGASWAVVDRRKSLWTVPPAWKSQKRDSHPGLDGAQNAPPTTAHKAVSCSNEDKTRKMTRLVTGGSA